MLNINDKSVFQQTLFIAWPSLFVHCILMTVLSGFKAGPPCVRILVADKYEELLVVRQA